MATKFDLDWRLVRLENFFAMKLCITDFKSNFWVRRCGLTMFGLLSPEKNDGPPIETNERHSSNNLIRKCWKHSQHMHLHPVGCVSQQPFAVPIKCVLRVPKLGEKGPQNMRNPQENNKCWPEGRINNMGENLAIAVNRGAESPDYPVTITGLLSAVWTKSCLRPIGYDTPSRACPSAYTIPIVWLANRGLLLFAFTHVILW